MRPSRVQPGQRFTPSAAVHNAVVDLVDALASDGESGSGGLRQRLRSNVVPVFNNTGSALDRWGVGEISGPVIGPADRLAEFEANLALNLVTPTATAAGRIGIAIEPIAAGKFGRAVLAGVTVCKVEVTDPTARFAAEKVGSAAKLVTSAQGPVQIIWREAGTSGDKWAVVRIGGGQAASGDPTHLILSATSIVGAAKPRWRYTLKRGITDTTTGLVTADTSALTVIAYNDAEDTGGASNANYQHGQSLTINGATITPGPVVGPVPAFWTGLYDGSGVPIYRFNQQNPAASLACA